MQCFHHSSFGKWLHCKAVSQSMLSSIAPSFFSTGFFPPPYIFLCFLGFLQDFRILNYHFWNGMKFSTHFSSKYYTNCFTFDFLLLFLWLMHGRFYIKPGNTSWGGCVISWISILCCGMLLLCSKKEDLCHLHEKKMKHIYVYFTEILKNKLYKIKGSQCDICVTNGLINTRLGTYWTFSQTNMFNYIKCRIF